MELNQARPKPQEQPSLLTQPSQESAQANNPIARKLNKILESRVENDKDLLEALKTLSVFFPENSIRTRRNLRSDIEKRSLVLNEEFLDVFRNIKEQLDGVGNSIASMSECSDNMLSRLKVCLGSNLYLSLILKIRLYYF
jgi:hypothetical protein